MICYLASPGNQLQASHLAGMPALLSFYKYGKWLDKFQQSFSRILIDSGAYSEMSSGAKVDGHAYKDWKDRWDGHADACAGLDDITGNWRRSMHNYIHFGGFPTIHDTDPFDLLPELLEISKEQGKKWIGIGLLPPRQGKERFIRRACENIPDDFHIHGWALRAYTHVRRIDSFDSTNWWRAAFSVRKDLPWLHFGEALAIVVKRYKRWKRVIEPTTRVSRIYKPTTEVSRIWKPQHD